MRFTNKFFIHLLIQSLVCSILFCVLLEQIHLFGFIYGTASGLMFSFLVSHIQGSPSSSLRGAMYIQYYPLLLGDMAKSTACIVRSIFSKTPPPLSILHEPSNKCEFEKVLVSNSITLTPGTITLEEDDSGYTILQLSSPNADTIVSSVFENRLPERTIAYDD